MSEVLSKFSPYELEALRHQIDQEMVVRAGGAAQGAGQKTYLIGPKCLPLDLVELADLVKTAGATSTLQVTDKGIEICVGVGKGGMPPWGPFSPFGSGPKWETSEPTLKGANDYVSLPWKRLDDFLVAKQISGGVCVRF